VVGESSRAVVELQPSAVTSALEIKSGEERCGAIFLYRLPPTT
jgi:hypothetical protein